MSLQKFGRLLISSWCHESTPSDFWMNVLHIWHGFVWIWCTPESNGFIDCLQLFLHCPLKNICNIWGHASCSLYSPRLHKRSSSQIIQFRFPSFLDQIINHVVSQFCCFFSHRWVNLHNMGNPHGFPWAPQLRFQGCAPPQCTTGTTRTMSSRWPPGCPRPRRPC